MQVSVKKTKGLERQLTIQVPLEKFDEAVNSRLQSMSRRVKVAGFRPGKVPLKVVRQKYGKEVQQEVMDDLVRSSYGEAIKQEGLKPAGYPQIDTKPIETGKGFEYTATFEVYPEVELVDVSKIKVSKPECSISDEDVDEVLEKLRDQRAEWVAVERVADEGDQVVVDYEGIIDGEVFEGGTAEKKAITIGAKQMIEGFEEQLKGVTSGESRELKVTFPKDYHHKEVAGKPAVFNIKAHEVLEKKIPDVDETFIKAFGIESGKLDDLLKDLRDHLHKELEQNIKSYVKKQIMDGLVDLHKIDVPNILIEQEIDSLIQQSFQHFGAKDMDPATFPREPFTDEASKRVKLSLVLREIIKENSFKADPKKVRSYIEQSAASYENPSEVVKYYYNNKEMLQNIEAVIVEEEIVGWAMEQAKIKNKPMKYSELIQENQGRNKQ